MTDDSCDSLFFEGSVLLTIYIIYIIINYILISYISYRGDIVGLHTLQFLTVRTVNCQIHSLCHEVVVLRSFLQVLHSEQLLGSLLAEILIGEVRSEGRLPQGGIASARRPTAAHRNERDYSRLRSLCPAWLPLYLLFVALNRQDTLNPIRRASR